MLNLIWQLFRGRKKYAVLSFGLVDEIFLLFFHFFRLPHFSLYFPLFSSSFNHYKELYVLRFPIFSCCGWFIFCTCSRSTLMAGRLSLLSIKKPSSDREESQYSSPFERRYWKPCSNIKHSFDETFSIKINFLAQKSHPLDILR